MNGIRIKRPGWGRWAGVAIAAVGLAVSGAADNILHARISHDSGGALVKGRDDADWSYATVNTLVLPGDTVWVDKQGVLEIEMAGGSFLRMADGSKAEIAQLPPSALVLGWTGSFYVQRVSRSTGEFRFQTPAATVNVSNDSQVRFDIIGEGATTVSVRWGEVTILTEGGAPVRAGSGQRVYIDPGLLPSTPIPFDRSAEDSFDQWNRERARLLALGEQALPSSVVRSAGTAPIGYADLAAYGDWVYVENRPYWRPTVVTEYVPYRVGYWSYVPVYGYVWVGGYPFSYITCHYGRWSYFPQYGWLWCYDPVWSPAWCAAVRYGPYFVWSPIDYYGRPCYYGATFTVGGIGFSYAYSSYCLADDLLFYGPCATYPVRDSLFVNINIGDVYIWNFGDRYRLHRSLTDFGSTALVRNYSPRRSIRGLATTGLTTEVASRRIQDLESGLGRAEFAARGGVRSVRTEVSSRARVAGVRSAELNETTLNPERIARRGERAVAALRGSHDQDPRQAEFVRSREARLTESISADHARDGRSSAAVSRSSREFAEQSAATNETPRIRELREQARGAGSRSESTISMPTNAPDRGRSMRSTTPSERAAGRAELSELDRAPGSRTGAPRVERAPAPDASMRGESGRVSPRNAGSATPIPERERSSRVTGQAPDVSARTTTPGSSRTRIVEVPSPGASERVTSRRETRPAALGSTSRSMGGASSGATRTPVPDIPRTREANVPRASEGTGTSRNSTRVTTLPQVPQHEIAMERSRQARESRSYEVPLPRNVPTVTPPSRSITSPAAAGPAISGPSPRYQAPATRSESYSAPMRSPSYTPSVQPRVQAPRYEAPQPRVSYQAPQRPSYSAPTPRVESSGRSFSAPGQVGVAGPSRSFDSGGAVGRSSGGMSSRGRR